MSTAKQTNQSSKWNSGNTGSRTKPQEKSADGEWTHVSYHRSSKPQQKRSDGEWTQRPKPQQNRSTGPKEFSQKRKFFNAAAKIDEIMATSDGNLKTIENEFWDIIQVLPSKEEKAKALEIIVAYSLHELITPESRIGSLIHNELSVSSALGSIKERDGYNLFAWGVWPRYGDKRQMANIVRTNDDVIKTVNALLTLNISPFRINGAKKESIVGTLNACLKDKKITQDTYDKIYQNIFGSVFNPEFYFRSIQGYIPELFQDDISYEKSLVLWGLCQSELDSKLLDTMFKMDIDRVGLADISRKTADIEYFPVIFKLIEFINSGKVNADFDKYFKANPINKESLIMKIVSYYMDKLYETYPTIYEHNISSGYNSSQEGLCFKYFESFGAFVWDIAKYLDSDDDILEPFNIKVKLGYGIRGLKKNKSNVDFLKKIYHEVHISNKILIENAFASVNIPFKAAAAPVVVEKVEKKVNHLENLKIGLEKIGNQTIIYKENEVSPPETDDAVYHMSTLVSKVTPYDFANAFVFQACFSLFTDNQISQLGGLVNYLDKSKILSKVALEEYLDENEALVIDEVQCDNPQVKKVISAIRSVF